MDGGNFHYVSYIFLKTLLKPYDLVVIDHHTDLLPPRFEGILSCGNWIRRALSENQMLKNVFVIGVSDHLKDTVDDEYKDRVTLYDESEILEEGWIDDLKGKIRNPVYLSIDKDAFTTCEVITDWDQGSLTIARFHEIWNAVQKEVPVISTDICGEYNSISGGIFRVEESDRINSRANERLLNILQE